MNWLNSVIFDIHKKVCKEDKRRIDFAPLGRATEQDSNQRLHQFQSRLKELDRRILELR